MRRYDWHYFNDNCIKNNKERTCCLPSCFIISSYYIFILYWFFDPLWFSLYRLHPEEKLCCAVYYNISKVLPQHTHIIFEKIMCIYPYVMPVTCYKQAGTSATKDCERWTSSLVKYDSIMMVWQHPWKAQSFISKEGVRFTTLGNTWLYEIYQHMGSGARCKTFIGKHSWFANFIYLFIFSIHTAFQRFWIGLVLSSA